MIDFLSDGNADRKSNLLAPLGTDHDVARLHPRTLDFPLRRFTAFIISRSRLSTSFDSHIKSKGARKPLKYEKR